MTSNEFKNLWFVTYSTRDDIYEITPVGTHLKAEVDLYLKKRAPDWLILSVHDSAAEAERQKQQFEKKA